MNPMKLIGSAIKRMGVAFLLLAGMFLVSCSSAPEPQPELSKEEIRQDADRFFNKMEQEESAPSSPRK
jgi:hypothetical protein